MRDEELPHLHPVEKGRMIAPQYDTAINHFNVTTADWKHVCSARFGEGRPCGFSAKDTTLWTGDSYRYDIFTRDGQMALRWWNGAGEGWLIAEDKDRRSETCLFSMIAEIRVEARRWDACHFIWQAAEKSARAAERELAERWTQAFIEGRMKKRKRGGKVRLEIVPQSVKA